MFDAFKQSVPDESKTEFIWAQTSISIDLFTIIEYHDIISSQCICLSRVAVLFEASKPLRETLSANNSSHSTAVRELRDDQQHLAHQQRRSTPRLLTQRYFTPLYGLTVSPIPRLRRWSILRPSTLIPEGSHPLTEKETEAEFGMRLALI